MYSFWLTTFMIKVTTVFSVLCMNLYKYNDNILNTNKNNNNNNFLYKQQRNNMLC